MKNKALLVILALSLSVIFIQCNTNQTSNEASIYMQTPYNSQIYSAVDEFSDEFNDEKIDTQKWNIPEDTFAAWSFRKENVNLDGEGNLRLTARHDPHSANGRDFYFTSGMLRSKNTKKYGYYETHVKGADLWPGVCSAFWLYTKVPINEVQNPAVDVVSYNEIDVMELQQIAEDKRMMACNLHIMVLKEREDGELGNDFVTAGKLPKMGQSQFPVDWDPEADYHTYACENRPDSIVFYIDNKRVASKPNFFWHMDEGMYVTLSLGMRTPYETYEGGRHGVETSSEVADEAGFPTEMIIDYVRVYERDYSTFPNNKRPFNRADFE
ncbi:MAG: family 16 glycosylhydrolase [Rikenellaceae bacterium]